jgi:LysR family transcriptional regulator for bpeEF and oprC
MDKLRAITAFCRIVERGSFAAAAHSLQQVPSALSKAVTALEKELGFTLFNRSTRKLALTVEGDAYYTRCRGLLAELEEAEVAARAGGRRPQGTLRVGIHPALRALVFSDIRRLVDRNPMMTVETLITNAPAALLEHGLDVLLRIGRLPDSTLVARRLGWVQLILCASPAYLRRWGAPKQPQDLSEHRAVIYARPDEEPSTVWEFTRGKERQTVSMPIRMVVRDGVGLVDLGVAGCGIVRPYDVAARSQLAAGRLQVVMPEWSSGRQPVYVAFPGSRYVPAKVRAFVEFAEKLAWS